MHKKIFILFTVLLSAFSFSQQVETQNPSVERSVTGVQIGLFGLNLYNEARLADKFALRTELGLSPAIWGGLIRNGTDFVFYPTLSLTPKYYYNIAQRAENGKNTKNNSANFVALQLIYIPDWFLISSSDNIDVTHQMQIIPTFGIRRNFAEKFNYEFRAGFGYGTTLNSDVNSSEGVLDLSFKVGYDF